MAQAPGIGGENLIERFKKREEELLRLNEDLEARKLKVLGEAQPNEALPKSLRRMQKTEADSISDMFFGGLSAKDTRPASEGVKVAVPKDKPTTSGTSKLSSAESREHAAPPRVLPPHNTGAGDTSGPVGDPSFTETLHSTITYQKKRIVSLSEDLEKAFHRISSLEAKLTAATSNGAHLAEENKKLNKRIAAFESERARLVSRLAEVDKANSQLSTELSSTTRERDELSQSLRRSEGDVRSKEARVSRLTEAVERLKADLSDALANARPTGAGSSVQDDRLASEVAQLTKQKQTLLQVMKKQTEYIGNLKKLNAHVSALKVLSVTDAVKALDLHDKVTNAFLMSNRTNKNVSKSDDNAVDANKGEKEEESQPQAVEPNEDKPDE